MIYFYIYYCLAMKMLALHSTFGLAGLMFNITLILRKQTTSVRDI